MVTKVLNPLLYERLKEFFDGKVKIFRSGEPLNYVVEDHQGRKRIRVTSGGEQYQVNCPLCGDMRGRCSVNHSFGMTVNGLRAPPLVHCFNENCEGLAKWFNELLRDEELGANLIARPVQSAMLDFNQIVTESAKNHARLANIIGLHNLPLDHPAIIYIRERGFTPEYLRERFGVFYSQSLRNHHYANQRLIAPVLNGGKRVGWLARVIPGHTPLTLVPQNQSKAWPYTEPKYWTSPGMRKSKFLYNLDNARHFKVIAIAEGPTDVWKIGPWGMALMGKKMSEAQCNLLCQAAGANQAWVILLGDASTERDDAASAWKSNYEMLLKKYSCPGLVRMHLFEKGDPGDRSPRELHDLVYRIMHRKP